ncbi:MAG: ATPase [Lachnospiraceae bacterium]|nr:ATPase [Lachnospiraceae bacterium]
MKRLKAYLSSMDNATENYKEMYEGKVIIPGQTPGNPSDFPVVTYDTTFWYGNYSFTIELTNKMALDRPTILCQIPAEELGIHVEKPCIHGEEPGADATELGISTYPVQVADHCYREFLPYLDAMNAELFNRHKTPEETGYYFMPRPKGEVMVRNTAYFAERPRKDYVSRGGNTIVHYPPEEVGPPQVCLCLRFQVQLPHKRLKKAMKMLVEDMPQAVAAFVSGFDRDMLQAVEMLAEKQRELRAWLAKSVYCAFIANGSILPRDAKTDLPMKGAIPFTAPKGDEITACGIKGLGIKKGVTVITGGGYSGKSTILNTIAVGIYDHAYGDGRELCVTDAGAMTITAEDGRCIKNIDISPFISWIPGGSTEDFSTDHASGSTSQAANILEAIDYGSKLLLIDEDRSATNFMIRDQAMKTLIQREPITPFTERVNELYESCGVSTILVIGGSGEYLSVADQVYLMDEYRIYDVTEKAKKLGNRMALRNEKMMELEPEVVMEKASGKVRSWKQERVLRTEGFTPYPAMIGPEKLAVPDMGFILIGEEKIDVRGIQDVSCQEQRTALGFMLRLIELRQIEANVDVKEQVKRLYEEIEEKGLDAVYSGNFPECDRFMALPRMIDLMALISRMREVSYE